MTAGSDPSKLVEDMAKRRKKRVLGVSLGQGQDVIARKLMTLALAEGHWVLLQNAHLGLGYLQEARSILFIPLAYKANLLRIVMKACTCQPLYQELKQA